MAIYFFFAKLQPITYLSVGISKDTLNVKLKLFFENEKKSGSGEVEDIWYDNKYAI